MSSPAITPLHAPPRIYTGNVLYAHNYAFLQDPQSGQTALLQYDNPFTGILDFTRAAQTAQVLSGSYPPGSPASLNGIMMQHLVNGQGRDVLHLC